MQRVINMAQALLERGRELWEQDQYEEADKVLTRLLGLRVLPPQIAERAQFYLGDIHLAQGEYRRARRHLAAALATGTGGGEVHFLMACALDWDEQTDTKKAFQYYKRAVELEPGQPLYSSAYALKRIRLKADRAGYDREALRRLRTTFAAAPEDPDIIYNYAAGLIELGRDLEAELALRRARKRWPSHAAFEELWCQLMERRNGITRTPSRGSTRLRVVADDEPIILRFPKSARRPALAKSLRRNARLKTALLRLDDEHLAQLAHRLGLPPLAPRGAIRTALLDRRRLRALLASLSAGSLRLIRTISQAGGTIELRSLRVRLDQPHPTAPHLTSPAVRPLQELENAGLVYLTTTADRNLTPLAMIPSDLRGPLRDLAAEDR